MRRAYHANAPVTPRRPVRGPRSPALPGGHGRSEGAGDASHCEAVSNAPQAREAHAMTLDVRRMFRRKSRSPQLAPALLAAVLMVPILARAQPIPHLVKD